MVNPLADECSKLSVQYWEERDWHRYLDGELLHDITDIRAANTIKSWLEEEKTNLSREKKETWLSDIKRWLLLIDERRCDKIDATTYDALMEVQSILSGCARKLNELWTRDALALTSSTDRKNEISSPNDFVNLAFWQLCSERKSKMLFFPGIQIEVAPFLQSVEVVSYPFVYTEEIEQFFAVAHPGYLYCFDHMDPKKEEDDTGSVRSRKSLSISPQRPRAGSIRRHSKRSSSTHSRPSVVATVQKVNRKAAPKAKQSISPPRKSPPKNVKKKKKLVKSTKNEEALKAALLSEAGNLWTQEPVANDDGASSMVVASHVVDLRAESLIGLVFEIRSYRTFSRKKQSGAWLVHTEKDMDLFELTGEIIALSLKVPVEEVFMGAVEPSMAFQEENGASWKKGVFTTHTQFDQNTFVMSTRLSKLGKIALFQCNDFHFPYRKWSVEFFETTVIFGLHTNTVALRFLLEGHIVMLETQTGDEFSKLKSLHGKRLSLQEMAIQMIRHGVYIFPNELVLRKHKSQVKDYELEIYLCRHICLNAFDAHANRMNSSLPTKTVIVNLPTKTLQVELKGRNEFEVTFGQDTGGAPTTENKCSQPDVLSNLFRWMLFTRAISLTK